MLRVGPIISCSHCSSESVASLSITGRNRPIAEQNWILLIRGLDIRNSLAAIACARRESG